MLNIGIVGCGYWGPNLIRNFNALQECNVKIMCDSDPQRLASMATLYPQIKQTSIYTELIEDTSLDAIVIATPVRFHFEMAMQTLTLHKFLGFYFNWINYAFCNTSRKCSKSFIAF